MVVHIRERLRYESSRIKDASAFTPTLDSSDQANILGSFRVLQKLIQLDKGLERKLNPRNVEARDLTFKKAQHHKLLSQRSAFDLPPGPSFLCDRIVLGTLGSAPVQAFVDTCAENLVTEHFIREQRLCFNPELSSHVRVADGRSLPTLGTIKLSWQFQGEDEPSLVRFHVVHNATRHFPVVLGGYFLWNSGTLTEHISRLRITPRGASQPRIFFQGSGHLRLSGVCEDRAVEMFPDLASDIPAMSMDFAREVGMDIDTSALSRVLVHIPGDRMITTCGLVNDVRLQLGADVYEQSFYLIDGLPGDILLDAEFLARTDAFIKYRDRITVTQQTSDGGEGVFLVVHKVAKDSKSSTSRWWGFNRRSKQPAPTPSGEGHIDRKSLIAAWMDRSGRLEDERDDVKEKYDLETDPVKKALLRRKHEELERTLEREGEEYENKYRQLE